MFSSKNIVFISNPKFELLFKNLQLTFFSPFLFHVQIYSVLYHQKGKKINLRKFRSLLENLQ